MVEVASKPSRRRGARKPRQAELPFKSWGGPRKGAGRPVVGKRRWVPRTPRPRHAARHPLHVTLRLCAGLPSLQRKRTYLVLLACFAKACDRRGFRITHYSVQGNHLHLVCEAKDRRAMSRGMQGLAIRIAKALNRLWHRRGKIFADRYHERVLRSPREVRNAICYVLHNSRHHGRRYEGPDFYASGWWLDGWRDDFTMRVPDDVPTPVAHPRTWLIEVGWRRCGLIHLDEHPGRRRSKRD